VNLGSQEFETLIKESAALRGKREFAKAISLIESKLPQMEEDCHLNAYLECFYAASEADERETAIDYARKIKAIDPDVPTVKAFLAT
jgi:hypothetical protein